MNHRVIFSINRLTQEPQSKFSQLYVKTNFYSYKTLMLYSRIYSKHRQVTIEDLFLYKKYNKNLISL